MRSNDSDISSPEGGNSTKMLNLNVTDAAGDEDWDSGITLSYPDLAVNG